MSPHHRMLATLLLLLQFVMPVARAATPDADCLAAFAELKHYIDQQQGYLSPGQLETSVAADTVRFSCDGSPDAYQKSLRDIAALYAPPPSAASNTDTSGSFSMSEQTESVLTILMFIALIAASSAGVFSFGSAGGSGGIIITPH